MTLVVAGRFEDGPRMVGDTRLTMSRSGATSGLLGGLLKVVILHPNLAVGFADDSGAAMDWIVELDVRPDVPYHMDDLLLAAQRLTSAEKVQLLLAELDPARVLLVDGGTVEDPNDAWGWIGASEAFSGFQREFVAAVSVMTKPDAPSLGAAMVGALESVVGSADHPTVGGLAIACVPTRDGFRYASGLTAAAGGSQSIPSGEWTTLHFGQGAVAGSYTEAILTPITPGLGVIGAHIRELRRGVLFWPSRYRQPIDFFDCDQVQFAARVEDEHGISISAPIAQ